MSLELLPALCLFAMVTSITPGPNNTMMLASGVNFGFTRSLPHIAGISIGFGVMTIAAGLGLHALLESIPQAYTVMRYLGAAYMLWLAWKLANSGPVSAETARTQRPMSFLAAAAFQWVNPKAWVMALGAVTTYLPPQPSLMQLAAMTLVLCVINAPCVGLWAACGYALRSFLQKPLYLRIFNVSMAVALVASLYPLLRN
jgi:threonine/homoserine/homoserine lactone efflux protein